MNSRPKLTLIGARQNNLKNLTISIPHETLTVITGPSGSGKSSLAFETIFAEGQRLYIESLSTYARQFLEKIQRPDIDHIKNISPTIAIEQKNTVKNSRSTVGTSTELYDYLRLLFSKIGKMYCPTCGKQIQKNSIADIVEFVLKKLKDQKIYIIAPYALDDLNPQRVIKNFIQRGFTRIVHNHELLELSPTLSLNTKQELWLVIDRLQVSGDIRHTLTNALETAYQEAQGRASVMVPQKESYSFSRHLRCSTCNLKLPDLSPQFFSFNNPYGACPSCKGFGNHLRLDEDLIIPNKNLSLEEGAIEPWTKPARIKWQKRLLEFAAKYKIPTHTPYKNISEENQKLIFKGTRGFPGIVGFFNRLEEKKYKMAIRVLLSRYKSGFQCPDCQGNRLRKEAQYVKIANKTITEILAMNLKQAQTFFEKLTLSSFEQKASKEILRQLESRLCFLNKVGVEYLTLNRLTKTLSGGEAQRIQLANQLGASLVQTTYVLDEPSIGLHAKDHHRLLKLLKNLRDGGNTVIVVEHDRDTIQNADYIIELGPQGGERGGNLIFQGTASEFKKEDSLTASYLKNLHKITIPETRRKNIKQFLELKGVHHHNLKSVDLKIPLNCFVCITGVSGSGKSSLIHDTLYNALARIFKLKSGKMGKFETISGFQHLSTVRLLDQHPIGKTSRSNPITFLKGYDDIRSLLASVSESRKQGYLPGHFSFNTRGGRCDACEGTGFEQVDMHFLSDVYLTCEHCQGKKFKPEILAIRYREKNIDDILNLTVDDAYHFFSAAPHLKQKLKLLQEVGLGYLKLGQSSTTLSGGEAQRLKIAKELSYNMRHCLYILDEPTTGLHLDDIQKLLKVLNKLIADGNSILVIEHQLDVIKCADYIIDLGPEGGDKGGKIIAEGSPEEVIHHPSSYTGKFLKRYLTGHSTV
ncbi:MAG: excinuclease ABC subunit UvrA [Deltaproteobacteria bacterium]|nr:excinuclease ABC subunit UvrA [Deltaproteobacteria bacterium]